MKSQAAFHSAFILLPSSLLLVAVDGVEPSSVAYRATAAAVELHRETLGRVGFEPTIPRLKGGCLRPLGYRPLNEINCGGRTRTFDLRINNATPYQLGYATSGRPEITTQAGRHEGNAECGMKSYLSFIHHSYFCIHHFPRVRLGGESGEVFFGLAAVMRFELISSRLQDECSSAVQLSYTAINMDRVRLELTPNSVQDCRSAN